MPPHTRHLGSGSSRAIVSGVGVRSPHARALDLPDAAVQLDHRPSTGSLVQAVDILRQDRTEPTGGLQRGQGGVAGVRLCRPRRVVAPALPGPTPDLRVVDVGLMSNNAAALGSRVHRPFGPRKSGMPESVLMPAPVSTTTRSLSPTDESEPRTWVQYPGWGSGVPPPADEPRRHQHGDHPEPPIATVAAPRGPARCQGEELRQRRMNSTTRKAPIMLSTIARGWRSSGARRRPAPSQSP